MTLDNIMVTDRNAAVIIDFGAAKMGNDSSVSRELFGKLGYFSPEATARSVWGVAIRHLAVRCRTGQGGYRTYAIGTGPESTRRVLDETPNLKGYPRFSRQQ